jgi:ferritin-like metal-binding protein YciE
MATTKQVSGKSAVHATAAKGLAKSGKSGKSANGKSDKNDKSSRLEEFFHDELKDIYWAEKHLVKTLPKLAKAATSEALRSAFADHLEVTKGHVTRLENVFGILGYAAQAKKCEAMEGITKEGEEIIEDTKKGSATRDVGLILAGQKTEHYEIATYGGLAQLAKTLGHDKVAQILESTLSEEKEADQGLSELAKNTVNEQASEEKN